jgi:hypothetical protein
LHKKQQVVPHRLWKLELEQEREQEQERELEREQGLELELVERFDRLWRRHVEVQMRQQGSSSTWLEK